MPPPNPTVDGPVKSLRQVAPGGDVVPGIFAGIAVLLLLGILRNMPSTAVLALIDLVLVAGFAVPAYVIYSGSRASGIFVDDRVLEHRALGRVRRSWPLAEIAEISPMSGGLKVIGTAGYPLREFRFRWWRTEQVVMFARASGLLAPTALEVMARSSAQVDPGKPGEA
ncbi:MAG: hypothetical protein ABR573_06015 [Candidatus Dormibacteria bacterium]